MTENTLQPRVSIVIVNWNGYEDTLECIASLQKINYKNYEIVLVDNGSTIDNFSEFENISTNFRLLRSEENLGFSGGNNIGIKYSLKQSVDYILLLNNDTIVEKNFLKPLIEKFSDIEDIGIVAPQINYYDEPRRVWSAGGKISMIRGSGFADSNKLESELKLSSREVHFVSGCCMLVRREVFQKTGLFDENFFLYVEDADFCYRVKKIGYKIYVTTQSKIFHKVNTSTKENFSRLPLYYTTRNRLYLSKKNFRIYFPVTFFYIAITMLLKSIYWFIKGNLRNILVVFMAFKDFIYNKMNRADHSIFLSKSNSI